MWKTQIKLEISQGQKNIKKKKNKGNANAIFEQKVTLKVINIYETLIVHGTIAKTEK